MKKAIIAATVLIVSVGLAQAGVRADLSGDAVVDFATTMDLPLMTVGNPGNPDDTHGDGYGGVDYAYNIGKFEVTAGQYTEFLNAVAATDTYGLYSINMWSSDYGCKIERTGSAGGYSYSVAADWEDRPVNLVSWGDAARLANWLTNGMPTGNQDLTTTEDGSYFLNGATTHEQLTAVVRNADARYVIPSEDEWYKAAYHKNDGVTSNYWAYPTGTDAAPSNDLVDPDPGNNANFYVAPDDYTIGGPYYRTEAGEFEESGSPYGTFDQGGNLWEWTEGTFGSSCRKQRGGAFNWNWLNLLNLASTFSSAGADHGVHGFRVAEALGPIQVPLDIKPDSERNPVNLVAQGLLPVVVYGTAEVDVTEIDLGSLLLNGVSPKAKESGGLFAVFEDEDEDGILDLVMHFEIQALGILPGTTELSLTGNLTSGLPLEGADGIDIVSDFNGDMAVNATDLAILKTNFATPNGWSFGDANADGFVDATDLALLLLDFGWTESAFGEPIPEPATLGLLGLGGLALLRRRR